MAQQKAHVVTALVEVAFRRYPDVERSVDQLRIGNDVVLRRGDVLELGEIDYSTVAAP